MFGRENYHTALPATKKKLVSPSGDLAAKREGEVSKAFPRNIKKIGSYPTASELPMGKPRLMNNGGSGAGAWPKGADTMGGVVGGKSDKGSYQGVNKKRRG